MTDSVTDETRSGDKSQRCDREIKNPSPTGEEESSSAKLGNKKESEGDFPVTQPQSITSEISSRHACCNGDGKMLSQGEGSCSTPHRDYERKPEVGDRIELTCISDIYNRKGTVTSVEELGTFVFVRAEFDDFDIHNQYGADKLRFGKDGNAYFA